MSKRFFAGDSDLLDYGSDWMLGAALRDLPPLEAEVSRFVPLCVNEASVERKHALMNQALDHANHASAPRLSLVSRLPEMKHAVFGDAEKKQQFSSTTRARFTTL